MKKAILSLFVISASLEGALAASQTSHPPLDKPVLSLGTTRPAPLERQTTQAVLLAKYNNAQLCEIETNSQTNACRSLNALRVGYDREVLIIMPQKVPTPSATLSCIAQDVLADRLTSSKQHKLNLVVFAFFENFHMTSRPLSSVADTKGIKFSWI